MIKKRMKLVQRSHYYKKHFKRQMDNAIAEIPYPKRTKKREYKNIEKTKKKGYYLRIIVKDTESEKEVEYLIKTPHLKYKEVYYLRVK